ncbi:VOC family protein [Chengkuizengella marina]|uniref:VOC domain-containing protein n=1 Tax=Chengkuizengella marina TaxID=2507566 RepID=A0A6N9Q4T7_9BACL|nr:VOC family protein [Chengkuizengella marina]NBI29832.1 hypothetical protein [Chengkuizengella marina]
MEKLFERVDTIIIQVKDYKEAGQWYMDRLGLESSFEDSKEKYIVLKVSETPITLHEVPNVTTPQNSCYPILYVKDIEKVHKHLQEKNVQVEDIQADGSVSFFDFYDLYGNKLEVCSF